MLFEFDREAPVSFWMKNAYIPLDMIFIAPSGVVTHIAANAEPLSERVIPSGGPCIGVLELNGGMAADRAQGGRQGSLSVLQVLSCTRRVASAVNIATLRDTGRRLLTRGRVVWAKSRRGVRFWVSRAVSTESPAGARNGWAGYAALDLNQHVVGCLSRGRPPGSVSSMRSRASFAGRRAVADRTLERGGDRARSL